MIPKKWLSGALGALLLVVGMIMGSTLASSVPNVAGRHVALAGAFAAPSGNATTNYCQLYLNTVANQMNTTPAKYIAASANAFQVVINQMTKDGTITSAQQAQLEQKLRAFTQDPCGAFQRWSQLHAKLAAAHTALQAAVAGALKMPASTLSTDLAAGDTVSQLATQQHVSLAGVNNAYLTEVRSLLAQAVQSQTITQSQANSYYSSLQNAVVALQGSVIRHTSER